MKIEKVNDNQIRCTLTKEDLASRQLKISELAYGTDKAKSLFRDMMQKASFELGFEAEDIPLMIEAVPVNADCIVLIITKVEDPEELDTRFSRFAPSIHDEIDSTDEYEEEEASEDEIMELFQKIEKRVADAASDALSQEDASVSLTEGVPETFLRLFHFDKMSSLLTMCEKLHPTFLGESTLYKDTTDGYLLLLKYTAAKEDAVLFHKLCNSISEYGACKKVSEFLVSYFDEHLECVLSENALSQLSSIG